MLWIHVGISGGTSMCSAAHWARERVPKPNANCNMLQDDAYDRTGRHKHPKLARRHKHPKLARPTCAERTLVFAMGNYTWSHIEREVNEDDLCEGFTHGIMLREPLARMNAFAYRERYANFGRGSLRQALAVLRSSSSSDRTRPFANTTGLPAIDGNWEQYDNFATRTLAGQGAYFRPPGQITLLDRQHALHRLHQLSTVLVLERLKEPHVQSWLLRQFAWSTLPPQLKKGRRTHAWVLGANESNYLAALNSHDMALYHSAWERLDRDIETATRRCDGCAFRRPARDTTC